MRTVERRRGVRLVLICAFIAGCGNRDATVTGTITRNSQALTHGQIHFISATGESASTTINSDGTFTCIAVPLGEVTVTVEAVEGKEKVDKKLSLNGPMRPPNLIFSVPERYVSPESSPLKLIVKPGPQKFNIELTDP